MFNNKRRFLIFLQLSSNTLKARPQFPRLATDSGLRFQNLFLLPWSFNNIRFIIISQFE